MAIKTQGSITVAMITDITSTKKYYLLQSSTLSAPTKPTANPPGGTWTETEPTYSTGSTNSLYTCDLTVFSDGTFAYSAVSLSSSYEAAKAAYNKAIAAADLAAATDEHFWSDGSGAHISFGDDHDTSGFHQLLTSVKNAFMHGTTELMTLSESLIELGKNSTSAVIKFCAGTGEIGVIDSMLTLFSDKVGVKGNSQAVLASNGESNVAASKQNTTYAGLSQMAATAPSTDADPAAALLQAKCTRNSDSSTVSETYISLEAKSNGKAPVTVKASDITLNSSNQNNKYTAIKTDGTYAVLCPLANGESVTMGAYDTSTGNPIDSGISFMPRYGTNNLPTAYMNVSQMQTPSKLIPMSDFEEAMTGGSVSGGWRIWSYGKFRRMTCVASLYTACTANASPFWVTPSKLSVTLPAGLSSITNFNVTSSHDAIYGIATEVSTSTVFFMPTSIFNWGPNGSITDYYITVEGMVS